MLLILPGFLCDILGLLLLIPPLRRLAARSFFASLFGNANFEFEVRTSGREQPQSPPRRDGGPRDETSSRGPVIEGEFERLDERSIDPRRSRRRDDDGKGT
jgi:UPF0716 family protein affecting phage T7 exclusion